ncbi:ABC transporter ATP-binding protein [Candidatus Pristimantibacillus sp. PTI5]|uniref:ABC transporter ATP-binding protein n=1 Tax=Candidatus Pristimantibacillus sp. PTI5 TaxID=3400422 RepID=UPI003B0157B5
MSSEYAIEVRNLSKIYKLYEKATDRLKEALTPVGKKYHKDFGALKEVSFSLEKGEALGIIGKNGSGKSTLLKIITGVLTPSTGTVHVSGRISALLELGAGFNPEYTGLENIYLNGTIMGISKQEVDDRLEEILAFADIGEFINQPVKSYSSGMFARLAFAVAINVDPDILIVDEALAVGDIHFQAKCYRKFDEFKAQGKTILFVTHSLDSIIRYCTTAIVLNEGELISQGSPKEMVDLFKKIITRSVTQSADTGSVSLKVPASNWKSEMEIHPERLDYGDKQVEIIDYGIFNEADQLNTTLQSDESTTFKMKVCFHKDISNPIFAYTIKDLKGMEIAGSNSWYDGVLTGDFKQGEELIVSFTHQLNLQHGDYMLSLGCTGYNGDELVVYHRLYDVIFFRVVLFKSIVGITNLNTNIHIERMS